MAEPLSDSQREDLERAVQQFVDAQLDGQQPDVDVFVKQFPDLEGQLRQRIRSLQEIDGLFSYIVKVDQPGSGVPAMGHDLVGQRLGDFEVLRWIGTGGMGAVFLARQVSLDRDVALKVVSDVGGVRGRVIERFKREATALARLSHPNIVPIYEVGQEGPYFYFAMEYVAGVSLGQLLDSVREAGPQDKASDILHHILKGDRDAHAVDGNLSGRTGATLDADYIISVSRMMVSVASALEYAHQRGVLHRDIKPSNILLDLSGAPKLVDFGLARIQAPEKLTVTGEFFGTPSYASPEQIRHPDRADQRSDVYSLAATYYECLTLQPPFRADTVSETLTKTVFTEPIPPKKHCPRLSNDFNTVLLYALQKRPEDRYQTAAQFAADIENILSFKPILAKRPSIAHRGYRALRRNPAKAVAFVILVLAIVLGYFLLSAHTQKSNRIAADRLVAIGDSALQIGSYAKAIEHFEAALAKAPSSAQIYQKIAMCYSLQGHQQKELEAYQKAIAVDPCYRPAYFPLAVILEKLGRREEQISALRQIVTTDPNHAPSHYKLGWAHHLSGDDEAAVESFRLALDAAPTSVSAPSAMLALAVSYDRLGHYEQAMANYKQAAASDPNRLSQAIAYVHLGKFHNRLGRYSDAVEAFKAAVAVDPNSQGAYFNLGLTYTWLRRHDEAIAAYLKSIDLGVRDANVYLGIALDYQLLGRYEESIIPLVSCLDLDPNRTFALGMLAEARMHSGHYEEAIATYRRYLTVEPSSDGYRGLALCCAKSGRVDEALEAMKQAVVLNPSSSHMHSELAWLYSKSGNCQLAIESANTALRADPNNADALGCLGASYIALGDYDKAIELCKQATAIDANYWEVCTYLGSAYAKVGDYDEAILVYTRVCEATEYKSPDYIDCLAAAYAGSGDFRNAVKFQRKAVELAQDKGTKQQYEKRLEVYEAASSLPER